MIAEPTMARVYRKRTYTFTTTKSDTIADKQHGDARTGTAKYANAAKPKLSDISPLYTEILQENKQDGIYPSRNNPQQRTKIYCT